MSEWIEVNSTINCITINTDASFHHKEKVSGYCYYIKSNDFTISAAGTFKKSSPKHPEEAEIMCIGNALHILLVKEHLPKATFIVINSDCKFAMNKIKVGRTKFGHEVYLILNRLKKRMKIKDVRFNHVKAHSGVADSRSWVNEYCDKNAKEQMRLALKNKLEKFN